jgi:hypothetical protein
LGTGLGTGLGTSLRCIRVRHEGLRVGLSFIRKPTPNGVKPCQNKSNPGRQARSCLPAPQRLALLLPWLATATGGGAPSLANSTVYAKASLVNFKACSAWLPKVAMVSLAVWI